MTQAQIWCDRLQAKLMAALDAAWETIATSDDPALIKRARDKAKACGEIAAQVRKIAAMTPAAKPAQGGAGLPLPVQVSAVDPRPQSGPGRALSRLKGGARGRL